LLAPVHKALYSPDTAPPAIIRWKPGPRDRGEQSIPYPVIVGARSGCPARGAGWCAANY